MNTKNSRFAASFLEQQRRRLLALRAELQETRQTRETEEKQIQSEAGEQAREHEDDSQSLAMLELDGNLVHRAAQRLAHVERALQKIDEGTYGLSDASGKPIPVERLEAMPEAIYTLAEQQAREPAA